MQASRWTDLSGRKWGHQQNAIALREYPDELPGAKDKDQHAREVTNRANVGCRRTLAVGTFDRERDEDNKIACARVLQRGDRSSSRFWRLRVRVNWLSLGTAHTWIGLWHSRAVNFARH